MDTAEKNKPDSEILFEIQSNIELFRRKWTEFCKYIETCAEKLYKYQKDQVGKAVKALDALDTKVVSEKKAAYVARLPKLRSCRPQIAGKCGVDPTQESPLTKLSEAAAVIEKEARLERYNQWLKINAKMSSQQQKLQDKGWIRWEYSSIRWLDLHIIEIRQLEPFERISFYTPKNIVNPLLWMEGYTQNREPNDYERLLFSYALLSIFHDERENIPALAKRIYRHLQYQGKRFKRDDFCRHLWSDVLTKESGTTALLDAWERVKTHLPKPKQAEVEQPEGKERGDEWIKVSDAAEILSVNTGTVTRWANKGRIKDNEKKVRKRRVLKSSVLFLKQSREDSEVLKDAKELRKDTRTIPDQH